MRRYISTLLVFSALALSSSDAFSLSPSAPQLLGSKALTAARCRVPRAMGLRMQEGTKEKTDDWDSETPAPAATQPPATEASTPPAAEAPASSAPQRSKQFDFAKRRKMDTEGPGFNQFDPLLTTTQFVSRRFGIVGGLAVVALLASTEGKEIIQAIMAPPAITGTGEVVKTESGLQYQDVIVGPPVGDVVGPGKLVGFNVKVMVGDKVLFDSYKEKPVAFKYGQRPFQNVVCLGLEEGLQGMRIGGKRKMTIPAELAPPGVKLPPGVSLVYEVELTEVLANYF